MTTLSDIFSKKAQRQRTVDAMKMREAHLDPLYEWCLDKFDEDSHPFLPLALSLTYGRLVSTFLLRSGDKKKQPAAADAASPGTGGAEQEAKQGEDQSEKKKEQEETTGSTTEEKTDETKSDKKDKTDLSAAADKNEQEAKSTETKAQGAEKKNETKVKPNEKEPNKVINSTRIQPSMTHDPAVSFDDRNGALVRIDESERFPRLQLTSKVTDNLDGLVNDLMRVLQMIKDPTKHALAVTTIMEKARALLPRSDTAEGSDGYLFGKLLVEEEDAEKRQKEGKLFCIFARVTLGWTAEKVRRATEAYHDHMWLCDQMQVADAETRNMVWKAAVVYKTVAQNQDKQQTYASRRYALLAACAAVGLAKASSLIAMDDKKSSDTNASNKNGNDDTPPPAKRPRLTNPSEDPSTAASKALVQELVEAAGKEAAFTRWIGGGSSGRWKIAADLKPDEIRQAMLSLAHLFLIAAHPSEKKQVTPRVADHVMWWQALSQSLSKLPETGEWETLASDLYDRLLTRDESTKTFSQNIQSFHEFDILEYESKTAERPSVVLVDKMVWEWPLKADPHTSVIVSKGQGGDNAFKTERKVVEPSVQAITNRAYMPTIYSEGMALNEWTVALLSIEDVQPTAELTEMLTKALPGKKDSWNDLLPKIVNKSLLLLLQESMTAKVGRKASVSLDSTCEVSVLGELTHDKAMCRGIVALYFHSLESIFSSNGGPPAVDDTFLRAILSCCMTCVVQVRTPFSLYYYESTRRLNLTYFCFFPQAAGMTHKIHPKVKDSPVYSFMQMCECTPMSFLHYAPLFRSSLTNANNASKFPLPKVLPRRVHREFFNAEMSVLDSVLWAKDPNFEDVLPDRVDDMIETTDDKCCWWPVKVLIDEKEEGADDIMYPSAKEDTYYLEIYHNLSVLMNRSLEVSHDRMERVCRALGVVHWRLLLKYSWQTFRHLLRSHIKLFYDRHIDHWILTTIYGVGKRMKFDPEITFARTIEAYTSVRSAELGESQCHRIVRQVKIKTSEGSSQLGHIILLYNKVFIPAMRSYLLSSEDLKEATNRLAAVKERETPSNLPIVTPSATDVDMQTNA